MSAQQPDVSTQQPDVAEARRAVLALELAVERLSSSHAHASQAQSVDLHRLIEDVGRVRVDLDLIAGPPAAVAIGEPPGGRVRDPGYDPREFVDGTYEGTTPRRQ